MGDTHRGFEAPLIFPESFPIESNKIIPFSTCNKNISCVSTEEHFCLNNEVGSSTALDGNKRKPRLHRYSHHPSNVSGLYGRVLNKKFQYTFNDNGKT